MKLHYRCVARSMLIAAACIGFQAGCGSGTSTAPPSSPDDIGEAGPNRLLRFKPEYKQMIGKNGELLKKRPPSVPKG